MASPRSKYVLVATAACLAVLAAAAGHRSIAGSYHSHSSDDEKSDRPYLGVQVEEDTDLDSGGARIEQVLDDTPADKAGLEDDDVIVEVDGRAIHGPRGLSEALAKKDPGDHGRARRAAPLPQLEPEQRGRAATASPGSRARRRDARAARAPRRVG
jgi:S1-C subfamily serine protease